jgi:two-component system, OmpR family, phosphate regulon sensor histidine kinase PhoR
LKRLRLQFSLFFILLAVSLAVLVWNSYRQLAREERELWRGQAEKVYNQMQAAVSDFLTVEDQRPFTDYQSPSSPLANVPTDDPRGLIGYFQIDPDGVFSTPQPFLRGRLEDLSSSLTTPTPVPSKAKGYVELGFPAQKAVKKENFAQNVYPNPVQEQAFRLEERKMNAAMSASKTAEAPRKDEAADEVAGAAPAAPAPPAAARAGAFGGSVSSVPLPEAEAPRDRKLAAIQSDPFQARLVGQKDLLFYRKVWVDHRQYLEGFAVDLDRFYDWLMNQSIANSELPEFALARLELQGQAIAQYGIVDLAIDGLSPFFERALGYPLNLFDWSVYARDLPRVGTRWFLNALSAAVAFLATVGLYLIYRTSAAQVAYSEKRQDFVSAVTHELKTPLTSIRMYSEMLEDGWAKDEGKQKEYYRQISKESGRLSRLIENVLQLARLEKKTYKLNLKKELPTTDFESICSELKKMAERQGFNLSWRSSGDLPPLLYDPEAIKQIFLTLLDNSLKFGAESSDKSLEASLAREGDRVVWSWRDRGPGIPEKELKKVFENFYRVENEMTRKTQGTGIGLAMSRMLTESMGAEIEARNLPQGGLEIRLLFPAGA